MRETIATTEKGDFVVLSGDEQREKDSVFYLIKVQNGFLQKGLNNIYGLCLYSHKALAELDFFMRKRKHSNIIAFSKAELLQMFRKNTIVYIDWHPEIEYKSIKAKRLGDL